MANPIRSSDLYKNEGDILKAIQEVKALREEYGKLKREADGKLKLLASSIRNANVTTGRGRQKLSSDINEAKKLANEYKNLAFAESEANKQLQDLRRQKLEANRIAKLEAQITASAAGSYNRLSAQYSLNKIKLNQLTAEQRANTAEGQRLERQTKEIYDEMKRLQEVTGKYTLDVGNYNKAASGLFSTLKRLAAVYLSFEGARRLGDVIFRQTKELDSLSTAYDKIIPDQEKLARTNEFLAETSEKYGINLLALRRNYLRFTAASRSSNLSAREQEEIFDSLAKASAALGLESIKVDRAFNAIEQIMSKGKVSSEELRQQLGDSLPGSLEIMADALGVTTLQLDDMLKKGEVLSEVAMPKFARQLQKAYGIENVNRIDNVASAQARFENSITRLVEKLSAQNVIEGFFKSMSSGLDFLVRNFTAITNLTKGVVTATAAYVTYRSAVLLSTAAQAANLSVLTRAIRMKGLFTTATILSTRAVTALNVALRQNPIALIATGIVAAYTAMKLFNLEINKSLDTRERQAKISEGINEELTRESLKVRNLFDAYKDTNKSTEERKRALNELKRIYPEYTEQLELETFKLEDVLKAQNDVNAAIRNSIIERRRATEVGRLQNQIIDKEIEARRIMADLPTGTEFKFTVTDLDTPQGNIYKNLINDIKELQKESAELDSFFDSLLAGGSQDFDKRKTSPVAEVDSGELDKIKQKYKDFYKELADILKEREQKEADFNKVLLEYYQLRQQKDEAFAKQQDQAELERLKKREERERERGKSIERENKKSYDEALKRIDKEQELEQINLELIGATERAKTKLRLEHERERYVAIIKLAETFGQSLSNIELEIFEAMIKKLDKQIDNLSNGTGSSFWDLLGFNLDDDARKQINDAFSFASQQVNEWFSLRSQLAQQRVGQANTEVAEAQREVESQIANRNRGYAHEVEVAKARLAQEKKNREEALKQQREAQRQEILLQTALQSSNLVTASSQILANPAIPFFLKAGSIALMFGTFAAAKLKAFQLTKEKRSEGGLDFIGNGSHSSGNDTYLGYSVKGRPVHGERGESHMVLKPAPTRKYKKILPEVFKALNSGNFENLLQPPSIAPAAYITNNSNANNGRMETYLSDIAKSNRSLVKNSEEQTYFDSRGQKIKKYKNLTETYVA